MYTILFILVATTSLIYFFGDKLFAEEKASVTNSLLFGILSTGLATVFLIFLSSLLELGSCEPTNRIDEIQFVERKVGKSDGSFLGVGSINYAPIYTYSVLVDSTNNIYQTRSVQSGRNSEVFVNINEDETPTFLETIEYHANFNWTINLACSRKTFILNFPSDTDLVFLNPSRPTKIQPIDEEPEELGEAGL